MDKINNVYDNNAYSNLNKWRLILGKYSDEAIKFSNDGTQIQYMDMDDLLDFLYARESVSYTHL